ncbi:MAG TPA: Ldh family oxidoreductase [Vicinamibacteria bacterium]|nr:Ldh family oxidoreductase [Vicinamibacteria bacterium]
MTKRNLSDQTPGVDVNDRLYVRHGRLHYFVREVLKRLRLPAKDASKVGDALVAADLAGVEGEGVRRLPFFASRISSGLINPVPRIQVVTEEQAAAVVDGDNGMGHLVAQQAMELSLRLANKFGVSGVAARNSNDFGMAGYYARMGLEQQMIGIVVSNSVPVMLPTYGTKPMLGANPIAIAIPSPEDASPFVLDIATTAGSRSSIEEALRRNEPIPIGLAVDSAGEPTTSPEAALEAMKFLPLGSHPETGSHKGFGLALAFDILSGVLSGASFGRQLAGAEAKHPDVAGVGHFFLAIRVRAFAPWVRFRNQMKDMIRQLTRTPPSGAPRVFYPGESEFALEQERRANGIPLDASSASELEGLARRLDLLESWEHLVEGRK